MQARVSYGLVALAFVIAVLGLGLLVGLSPGLRESQTSSSSSEGPSCRGGGLVTLTLGTPSIQETTFSYEGGSTSFPASELIPLTVSSSIPSQVCMSETYAPRGVWVHFSPSVVSATPNGTTTQLILAGAVQSTSKGPNSTLVVQADSGASSVSSLSIPIIFIQNLTVLHTTGPLGFPSPLMMYSTDKSTPIFGVVYDPSSVSSNSSIGVTFSINGMGNGSLAPMPDWLTVTPLNTSITLSPYMPEYFEFVARAHSAPAGTYEVQVGEQIEGTVYNSTLTIVVTPPAVLH
jgi:hypothetical protein